MRSAKVSSARVTTRSRRATPGAGQQRRALVVSNVAGEQTVTVDKPVGITFAAKKGADGGVIAAGVKRGSNADQAGIKQGDTILYTSSYFGDELWPADQLGFVRTAVQACPGQVDIVYIPKAKDKGDYNIKLMPKRSAPKRFGNKLSAAQKERATHICLDCGYIYCIATGFVDQPRDYVCPQCNAPKKRFAKYDVETNRAIGGNATPVLSAVAGIVSIGLIAYLVSEAL